jgi:hypothetical protein
MNRTVEDRHRYAGRSNFTQWLLPGQAAPKARLAYTALDAATVQGSR